MQKKTSAKDNQHVALNARYMRALEWLHRQLPCYQRVGSQALRPQLRTIKTLLHRLGSPEKKYKVLHIAGTNGKGSVAHSMAAILAQAGYRVGLYTSPHLADFRERIRVNGKKISRQAVVDFVTRVQNMMMGTSPNPIREFPSCGDLPSNSSVNDRDNPNSGHSFASLHHRPTDNESDPIRKPSIIRETAPSRALSDGQRTRLSNGLATSREPVATHETPTGLKPSFFEVSVAMGLHYFADKEIDMAVVEVGMGGRWDATNVFERSLGVITSIDYDHTEVLGNTLEAIAREKVAIARPQSPFVLGNMSSSLLELLKGEVARYGGCAYVASGYVLETVSVEADRRLVDVRREGCLAYRALVLPIAARYYLAHVPIILTIVERLRTEGYAISDDAVRAGFERMVKLTGLRGRYERISEAPCVRVDVAHNPAAWKSVFAQAQNECKGALWIIIGLSKEKERHKLWRHIPKDAYLLLTQARVERALPVNVLAKEAKTAGMRVREAFACPNEALAFARRHAKPQDSILVTGSCYVVAELKALYSSKVSASSTSASPS